MANSANKSIPILKIHFEDHGQDFLEWTIDQNSKVVDCQPFQASIWCGSEIIDDLHLLAVNDKVNFYDKEGTPYSIKYRIEKIEWLTENAQPLGYKALKAYKTS